MQTQCRLIERKTRKHCTLCNYRDTITTSNDDNNHHQKYANRERKF